MSSTSPAQLDSLRALVRTHRVVFEVRTVVEMIGEERRKIGFDVVLSGTDGRDDSVTVTDAEGVGVWGDLVSIARAILPPAQLHSELGLRPFDRAVHNSPQRDNRDDVELVIGIRHEMGALDPIDPAEEGSLHGVVAALRALGVPEGRWKDPEAASPPR